MKIAVLLLISVQIMAAETFTVIHKKKGLPNGSGTIEITDDGIRFTAKKQKRSRQWSWLDIQHFDRISETEFNILTYEDQKRFLGWGKSYRFLITEGTFSDELFRRISEKLERPVTNRVVRDNSKVRYEIPVKHQHGLGSCEGILRFTDEAIYYLTDHAKDAREWLLARDVDSIWSSNLYHLELHVYENNRREFNRTRVFKYQLKKPLDSAFYRELKLTMYKLYD